MIVIYNVAIAYYHLSRKHYANELIQFFIFPMLLSDLSLFLSIVFIGNVSLGKVVELGLVFKFE